MFRAEQVELAQRLGVPEVQQDDFNSYLECAEASSLNVVLLMDVLEHLTRSELFDTLDEVFRILKPGGRCIAHVPNAEGLVRHADTLRRHDARERRLLPNRRINYSPPLGLRRWNATKTGR